ncbi:MAG: acyl carrier protein [Erythrobacter sp.]|uniref:acyl carrier protein n=1 Tax=Erythrobacter sp. TaxID=1042 RepID=UPI003C72655B
MIEDRIKRVFLETMRIDESAYSEDLAAGEIPEWDSLRHVNLLMAVERELKINFDIGDSIDIETVGDLIDTAKRYV